MSAKALGPGRRGVACYALLDRGSKTELGGLPSAPIFKGIVVTQHSSTGSLASLVQPAPASSEPLNREDLARAAESLSRLFGSPQNLTDSEAREAVDVLSRIPGTNFTELWADPKGFRQVWNENQQLFVGSPEALPLEESVYKAWTGDRSHPLAGEKGMAWGDPASHMLDVLESFGMIPDPEATMAPDHLAVLLEFLGFLIENRPPEEIRSFCGDHLDWVHELRKEAEERDLHQAFIGVVDAVESLAHHIISTSAWEKNRG